MTSWQQLESIPNRLGSKLLYDNHSRRLFAIQQLTYSPRLFQYSFMIHSWIEYEVHFASDYAPFWCSHYNPAAISDGGNTIYLCGKEGEITVFELNNDNSCKMKIIKNLNEIQSGITFGTGIMIKNEFHIIGGVGRSKHIKYDSNKAKCDTVHDLRVALNFNGICVNATTKIRNKVLLFGGYNGMGNETMDTIYQYNICDNQWTKLQSKLPKPLGYITGTQILNGQYILLFAGQEGTGWCQDDIYIYSVRDGTFKTSKVKCPQNSQYQSFTINDKPKDNLATFGWIRCEWRECGMNDHLFPPEYLIRIIGGYYTNEWIHLLNSRTGEHYRMNAFDIIDN